MNDRKTEFHPLGDPDKPVPEMGIRTPAMEAVDRMFLTRAKKALAELGQSALDFLSQHEGASKLELAKRLNRGVSAIGLVMAIYDEAANAGVLRDTAKDILIRTLRSEYEAGWSMDDDIDPIVRIGSWATEVRNYSRDEKAGEYAWKIITELASGSRQEDGWKPNSKDDPLVNALFDAYWPKNSA